MAKKPGGGKDGVVVSLAEGERKLARRRRDAADDPPPHMPRGPEKNIYPNRKNEPPNWTENDLGLPSEEPCPVEPLGVAAANYFFIDSARQFRTVSKLDHSEIQNLFGLRPNYPMWMCPRYGRAPPPAEGEARKPPPIESFDDDDVRTLLIQACQRRGLFDPATKMRGRGGWAQPQSSTLLYHAGEELWLVDGEGSGGRFVRRDTGLHEGYLYPRLAELPAPWERPFGPDENPAGQLLENYRTWNWARPDIDPILLLGHHGVSFLGAALDWRPAILLLGDAGWGKSEIRNGLNAIFGDALCGAANTSAAGIYQTLAHDVRPVAVDELEPGANARKVQDLVDLMRQAASGDFARRGSSDHQPVAFQMRSSFFFSAINNPLHDAADLSRVAILRLRPLGEGKTNPPVIDADTTGPMILARLMRQWGARGEAFHHLRQVYMDALREAGHAARGQKTYGTLLACAEMLLGRELGKRLDVPLSDHPGCGAFWAEKLAAAQLPEMEFAKPNWRSCLEHLLEQRVEMLRGGARAAIGKVLAEAERSHKSGAELTGYSVDTARAELESVGLGLLAPGSVREIDAGDGFVLAIPNDTPRLVELYRGTAWEHKAWMEALRSCPVEGVVIGDQARNRVYINGKQTRCTLVVMGRYHQAPER